MTKSFFTFFFLLFATNVLSIDHLSMKLHFDKHLLNIEATYQLSISEPNKSAYFILHPEVDSLNISGDNIESFIQSTRPDRPLPYLNLNFSKTPKIDEKIDIKFTYQIDMNKNNHMNSDWIELNVDKFWFPNFNDIDNKFTYDVTITGLPKDYSLIGHPDAEICDIDSDNISIQKTTPEMEVLVLAGKNMKEWKAKSTSLITFITANNISNEKLQSMHTKISRSIDFMNHSFGKSNPIQEFKVLLRNTTKSEIGFQFARKNMIITGKDFDSYANLSHEIAHYWWADADFIEEPWLNESFANYSMFSVLEKYDHDAFNTIFSKYKEKSINAPPVQTATLFSNDAYLTYYIKGAVLLKKLETIVGSKTLNTLLKRRVDKEINTTKGLLTELEDLTNSKTLQLFTKLLQD